MASEASGVTIDCHAPLALLAAPERCESARAARLKQTGAAPETAGRHSRQPSAGTSSDVFDCNICLDTAMEPVITMCGHLYCWPCIYRWLELRREESPFCPMCKADISPDRMIPVYGRGQARVDPRCATAAARLPPNRRRLRPLLGLLRRLCRPPWHEHGARPHPGHFSEASPRLSLALRPLIRPTPRAIGALTTPIMCVRGRRRSVAKEHIPQRPPGQRPPRQPASPEAAPQSGLRQARPRQPGAPAGGAQAGLSFLSTVLGFQLGGSAAGDDVGAEPLSPAQVQQAFLSRLLLLLGSFVILCLLLF